MQTLLTTDPMVAADILRRGGIVAVPTETVYGLAARFDDPNAVARIYAAKQRPTDNPLIVHIGSISWLPRLTDSDSRLAQRLLNEYAPGPLTVTVPRGAAVSDSVTAGLNTVAVRIPDEPQIQTLLGMLDIPLVAPSANRSGRPSPTTWEAVRDELDGRIDAILMGQPSGIGIESTVVDCCSSPPRLLRPGAISFSQLCRSVPDLRDYDPTEIDTTDAPSPGLRHRHYSPRARVVIVDSVDQIQATPDAAYLGMDPVDEGMALRWSMIFATVPAYAAGLFAGFRRADQTGIRTLYCQRVGDQGIGRGLMDRMQRAAQ
jgi:L-threonylcarbamoyladenylate synthase